MSGVPDGWVIKREGVEAFVSGPNGGGWIQRKGTLWQRTLFDLVDAMVNQSEPAPTPLIADGDAKDAARYRWLRDNARTTDFTLPRWTVAREEGGYGQTYRGEELDAAIDTALQQAADGVGDDHG